MYVDNDLNSNITLTPEHFLNLNTKVGVPELDTDDTDPDYIQSESSSANLLKIWKKGRKILKVFWRI